MLVLMCLYISLSNGYFLIKCHLLMGMFLKLGRAGCMLLRKAEFFAHCLSLLKCLSFKFDFGRYSLFFLLDHVDCWGSLSHGSVF